MRCLAPIFCLVLLTLAGCAPAPSGNENGNRTFSDLPGTTGGFKNGTTLDYVSNGDSRVQAALDQPDSQNAKPAAPNQSKLKKVIKHEQKVTPAPAHLLRWRLREFEISRFKKDSKEPSRFGASRYVIKVFFKDEKPVVFQGQFQGSGSQLSLDNTVGRYRFYGNLADSKNDSKGDFYLYDSQTQQAARIFYRAYKARLTVHEDSSNPVAPGSDFAKQIDALKTNTFGWVHNWVVVRGVSFYLVDIVRLVPQQASANAADQYSPVLSFKGESLRTGMDEFPTTNLTPDSSDSVMLVGNGDQEASRMFSVTYTDPKTKKTNQVMLDVQDVALPADDEGATNGDDQTNNPAPQPQAPAAPTVPSEPTQPQPPEAPPQVNKEPGKSFLKIDMSLPRTAKMTRDLARNRSLPGVKEWIAKFTKQRSSGFNEVQRFFWNANPFRPLINAISETFDVSPVFADHTFVESSYFTGGHYRIERASTTTALGPFQFVVGTAQKYDLIGSRGDDRRYFAPAACAAARYIGNLADQFKSHDSTVAILAYFQGKAGAAAAIYCSYSENAGNRRACARRINKKVSAGGMTRSEYSRDLRLVNNFDYNYSELDRMAAIPTGMRTYVRQVLAVYFISQDFEGEGFSLDGARQSLPKGVFPGHAIQDSDCQAAVQSLGAGV